MATTDDTKVVIKATTPIHKKNHEFDSHKEAIDSIRKKVFDSGFDVVIRDSHVQNPDDPEDRVKSFLVYVCIHGENRSGETPKVSKKIGCPFRIRVRVVFIKDKEGKKKKAVWRVTRIFPGHTHEMLPTLASGLLMKRRNSVLSRCSKRK